MPRANRYYIPDRVWHITHRCHQRQFLLSFARDRRAWVGWLFQARKRFGLCVFNYQVTSNHVHLLVKDRGRGEIARSMQLIEGRTAQGYNWRKKRSGAFWQDRYHATAVQTGNHLVNCLIYIDLNMVRAGKVAHPRAWPDAGYHEIQCPRLRCRIIDRQALSHALELASVERLATVHAQYIDAALERDAIARQPHWSEAVAVGTNEYVKSVAGELGIKRRRRKIYTAGEASVLAESPASYGDGPPPQRPQFPPGTLLNAQFVRSKPSANL